MSEVVSHCGFDLHFPDSDIEHLFMYLLAVVCLLWKNIDSDPLSIFSTNFFLTGLCGMQDLSFQTRNQTRAPSVETPSPNHWNTREFPQISFETAFMLSRFSRV